MFASEVTETTQAFARVSEFSAGLAILSTADPSPALANGQNEVWYDSTMGAGAGVWSTRWNNNTSCVVIESDIRFGAPVATLEDSNHWPYIPAFTTDTRPIHGLMTHEGAHCIGLGRTNNVYNIMGAEYSHVNRNNTTTFYGPGEDGSTGLIDLHGERSGKLTVHFCSC